MRRPLRLGVKRLAWTASLPLMILGASTLYAGPTPANQPCGPACQAPSWDPQAGWTYRQHANRLRGQGRGGLRYHDYHYPYDEAEHHRRTYPHTYRGQFGLEPEAPRLRGRFRSGPAYSPFNRYYEPPGASDPVEPLEPDVPSSLVESSPAPDVRPRSPAQPWGHEVYQAPRPLFDQPAPRQRDGGFDDAWALLGNGHAERSQYAFASLALGRPTDGLPKAGFALSVALQNDHRTAAFLLRRALKVDAPALRDVPMTDPLRRHAQHLLAVYEETDGAKHRLSSTDTLLMSAVLHYLLGNLDAARGAAVAAVELGDRDPSIFVLLALLHVPNDELAPPGEPRRRTDLLALRPDAPATSPAKP